MLRALILRLVHYVLTLGIYLKQLILQFPYAYSLFLKKRVAANIRSDARTLKKLPLHVGLLVVENEFSYRDLANIIVWSVALGISYISVYDFNGEIKRNSFILQKEIQKGKQDTFAADQTKYDIDIQSVNSSERKDGGCSNVKQVKVHLLSVEDGRQNLVKLTRQFCHLVAAGQYRVQDIMPNNVDSYLQDIHKFPDPDVILKFGPVDSLVGFMPWQMRLTEILSLPSHQGIAYKSFLSAMVSYGNKQQRFGT